ncbi:MAG: hypothetical protein IJU03_03025 [Thermoguttaceae bacterium]|nr:hypothetical protein [Thermoguttaceae bacterium]
MQGFLNCAVSAIVGAVAAIGASWFISASDAQRERDGDVERQVVKAKRIEVESLVVGDSILLVSRERMEPTLEIRDGAVYAQQGVYADLVASNRMLAQKFQTTPDEPLSPDADVSGEIAVDQEGGAYLALLSPGKSHALTIGFDANERGGIVSQNNKDNSRVAQAVFVKPSLKGGKVAPASGVNRTSAPDRLPPPPANVPTPMPLERLDDELGFYDSTLDDGVVRR